MNRATFMAQLRAGLAGLHAADIEDCLADYESHFADGIAAGRSEAQLAEALGDPMRLARELRAEVGFKRWEQDRSAGNFLGVILALLGLATIDLVFLLPALFVMIAVFLALAAACLGVIIGGTFLFVGGATGGTHHGMSPMMQFLLGLGLLSGGVGGGALLLLITDWVARALIRYARLHFRLFDSATNSVPNTN